MIGTSIAICSARSPASVLMPMISAATSSGCAGEQFLELGVAHELGVVLQAFAITS